MDLDNITELANALEEEEGGVRGRENDRGGQAKGSGRRGMGHRPFSSIITLGNRYLV